MGVCIWVEYDSGVCGWSMCGFMCVCVGGCVGRVLLWCVCVCVYVWVFVWVEYDPGVVCMCGCVWMEFDLSFVYHFTYSRLIFEHYLTLLSSLIYSFYILNMSPYAGP